MSPLDIYFGRFLCRIGLHKAGTWWVSGGTWHGATSKCQRLFCEREMKVKK